MDIQNLNCLLVDEDSFSLLLLRRHLESLGVRRFYLSNGGDKAEQLLNNSQDEFDVVFCDLDMPENQGARLIQHMEKLKLRAYVVVIGDLSLNQTINQFKHPKIIASLLKPLRLQMVEMVVQKLQQKTQINSNSNSDEITEDELRLAIKNQQIIAHFQPQVSIRTQKLVGAEGLAHWNHRSKGLLEAKSFIPLAESCGLINSITETMLHQCCHQISRCKALGIDIRMSVNISSTTLEQTNLYYLLSKTTEKYRVRPDQITLELTESRDLTDLANSRAILTELRLLGYSLSIDDFGTGYSSLEKLQQLPFNELKIDKCFIKASDDKTPYNRAILESTIDLAKKLGMACVAEGIEGLDEWKLISELDCDTAQGYFISRSLSPEKFLSWAQLNISNTPSYKTCHKS